MSCKYINPILGCLQRRNYFGLNFLSPLTIIGLAIQNEARKALEMLLGRCIGKVG
jgi:hypothetical protein